MFYRRSAWMLAALLVGCDSPAPIAVPQGPGARSDFTDEDRRVTSALSLGAHQASVAQTPFEKAAVCEMGLARLRERASAGQALRPEQQAMIESANKIFRVRQAEAGLPPAERAATRARLEQTVQTESEWGRIVIGCLHSLT